MKSYTSLAWTEHTINYLSQWVTFNPYLFNVLVILVEPIVLDQQNHMWLMHPWMTTDPAFNATQQQLPLFLYRLPESRRSSGSIVIVSVSKTSRSLSAPFSLCLTGLSWTCGESAQEKKTFGLLVRVCLNILYKKKKEKKNREEVSFVVHHVIMTQDKVKCCWHVF